VEEQEMNDSEKLERFVPIVNIRINKAIPTAWEIP